MKSLLHVYEFNLGYIKALVDDIPDDRMCEQPSGVVNHPAWTLGHLVGGTVFAGRILGLEAAPPELWRERYGIGTTPSTNPADHPTKAELLEALEAGHVRVAQALENIDPAALAQPTPDDRMRSMMPTVGDAMIFILVNHEATHIGELAVWRRAAGLPRVAT